MSTYSTRILIALFLIAHGWIHYSLTKVPTPAPDALRTPFWPGLGRADIDPLWLASRLGLAPATVRVIGIILWIATVAGFCIAGLALIILPGQPMIWQTTAVFGATASLLLLIFYWHPWLVMGVLINLAVYASTALHWPAALFTR